MSWISENTDNFQWEANRFWYRWRGNIWSRWPARRLEAIIIERKVEARTLITVQIRAVIKAAKSAGITLVGLKLRRAAKA